MEHDFAWIAGGALSNMRLYVEGALVLFEDDALPLAKIAHEHEEWNAAEALNTIGDLVDYVSEESAIAGNAAAKYLQGKSNKEISVSLKTDGRVRYTVPQRLTEIANTSVYFRVADVYRDARIVVRDGDKVIISKKKQRLAPAEMEKVELTAEMISALSGGELSFSIEM